MDIFVKVDEGLVCRRLVMAITLQPLLLEVHKRCMRVPAKGKPFYCTLYLPCVLGMRVLV
jgi:hypothetical protein